MSSLLALPEPAFARKRSQDAIGDCDASGEQLNAKSIFYPENRTKPKTKCTAADVEAHIALADRELKDLLKSTQFTSVESVTNARPAAGSSLSAKDSGTAIPKKSKKGKGKLQHSKLITSESKIARIMPRFGLRCEECHGRHKSDAPCVDTIGTDSTGSVSDTVDAITARIVRRQARRAERKAQHKAKPKKRSSLTSGSDHDPSVQTPEGWQYDRQAAHDWVDVTPRFFARQAKERNGTGDVPDANPHVGSKRKTPATSLNYTRPAQPVVVATAPGLVGAPHPSLPPIDAMSIVRNRIEPIREFQPFTIGPVEPYATETEFPWWAPASAPTEPTNYDAPSSASLPVASATTRDASNAGFHGSGSGSGSSSLQASSVNLPELARGGEGDHNSPATSRGTTQLPTTPMFHASVPTSPQRQPSPERGVIRAGYRFPPKQGFVPRAPPPTRATLPDRPEGSHRMTPSEELEAYLSSEVEYRTLPPSKSRVQVEKELVHLDQKEREQAFFDAHGYFPAMVAVPLRRGAARDGTREPKHPFQSPPPAAGGRSHSDPTFADWHRRLVGSPKSKLPPQPQPYDPATWHDALPLVHHTTDFGSFHYPVRARNANYDQPLGNALGLNLFAGQDYFDRLKASNNEKWAARLAYEEQLKIVHTLHAKRYSILPTQPTAKGLGLLQALAEGEHRTDHTPSAPAAHAAPPSESASAASRRSALLEYKDDEIDWHLIAHLSDNPAALLATDEDRLAMIGGAVGDPSGFLDEPIEVACYRQPINDAHWSPEEPRSPKQTTTALQQTSTPAKQITIPTMPGSIESQMGAVSIASQPSSTAYPGDQAFRSVSEPALASPRFQYGSPMGRGGETASYYKRTISNVSSFNGDGNVANSTLAYLRDHELRPDFTRRFRITDKLGAGGYGLVCVAVVTEDQPEIPLSVGTEVAVKFLFKRRNGSDEGKDIVPMTGDIPTEAHILRSLNHEGIIKCYDVYEDPDMYYLILELHGNAWNTDDHLVDLDENEIPRLPTADHPATPVSTYLDVDNHQNANVFARPDMPRRGSHDLFECIESRKFSKKQCRYVFKQLVDAVAYMHQRGVYHRDIKDENVVIDKYLRVKLIDFGGAVMEDIRLTPMMRIDFKGTEAYSPPEVYYGHPHEAWGADIWALGVLLCVLLTGELPGRSDGFPDPRWPELRRPVDRLAYDLLKQAWTRNPNARPDIYKLSKHPWFTAPISEKPDNTWQC